MRQTIVFRRDVGRDPRFRRWTRRAAVMSVSSMIFFCCPTFIRPVVPSARRSVWLADESQRQRGRRHRTFHLNVMIGFAKFHGNKSRCVNAYHIRWRSEAHEMASSGVQMHLKNQPAAQVARKRQTERGRPRETGGERERKK